MGALGLGTTLSEPWYGYPFASVVALWLVAALAVLLQAALLNRRGHISTRYAGVWLLRSTMGVVLAVQLPEASFLFILPAAVAGVSGLASWLWRRDEDAVATQLLALVPALAAAVLWFPLVLQLETAMTLRLHPAITSTAALALGTALPVLSVAPARRRWHGVKLTSAALTGALAVAIMLRGYSVMRPQRLSVAHFQRAGEPAATWMVDASWGPVPDAVRELAGLEPPGPPPVRWAGHKSVALGEAPRAALALPELDVTERHTLENGSQRMRIFLRSPRQARTVGLLIPPKIVVTAAAIEGRSVQPHRLQSTEGWWKDHALIAYVGAPAAGFEMELRLQGNEPFDIELFDVADALPDLAQPLLDARGALGTPSQNGDLSMVSRRLTL